MYVVVYGEKQRAIYAHRQGKRLAFPSHDEAPSSALNVYMKTHYSTRSVIVGCVLGAMVAERTSNGSAKPSNTSSVIT